MVNISGRPEISAHNRHDDKPWQWGIDEDVIRNNQFFNLFLFFRGNSFDIFLILPSVRQKLFIKSHLFNISMKDFIGGVMIPRTKLVLCKIR